MTPTSGAYIPAPARGDCPSGKVQYASRKQAKAWAKKAHRAGDPMGAYPCGDCGWFHIGHKPTRVRNGEVDKDAWLRATRGESL